MTSPQPSGRATWCLAGPEGVEQEVQVTGRFTGNTASALRKAAVTGLDIVLLPPRMARLDTVSRAAKCHAPVPSAAERP